MRCCELGLTESRSVPENDRMWLLSEVLLLLVLIMDWKALTRFEVEQLLLLTNFPI